MVPRFEEDVTARVTRDHSLEILAVELVVVGGPGRGQRVPVFGGVAKIGTAVGNELRLADSTVSRVHCEVRVKSDAITLKDCGSTNGTFVEGVRLKEGEVAAGTLVRVGNTVLRIEVGDEPAFVEVSEHDRFGELLGSSVEMRRLYAVLERVARTDSTVLVQGETGTGKDVVARSLHAASNRAPRPFVPVDCGAIPENLIESELFGHVRGAFSGAVSDRRGVFEEADGGTLFLDEIGEMPVALQPKLLRAIETRSVRPVGANTARPVDVRLVAATNKPLERCVNDGTFREDLYYRLAVVEVRLPSLRARRGDIPVLARHFYHQLASANRSEHDLQPELLAMLSTRSWPGNVRELRNFIERSVSLGFTGRAQPSTRPRATVPPGLETMVPLHLPLKEARDEWTESFESIYVRAMLKKTGGNMTRAAELAGVSRRFLQRMVARLGIDATDVGPNDPDDPNDPGE